MDRALWVLLQLRFKAWLRREGRALLTVRGVLVALFCLLTLAPALMAYMLSWTSGAAGPVPAEQTDAIRRFVPLVLLIVCVANIVTAAGEQAIAFSPAGESEELTFASGIVRRACH